ncbi:EAL domain-containing response regulator [Vibrio sp.]|uniref:EAL domain-containing response regulator n=1 Tax=Vibrio sp. TaxID=678 RepID=UPI003D14D9DB
MGNLVRTILIIDDQAIVRLTLAKCLEKLGNYHIVEAENGIEAQQILDDQSIDLVFCDLNMPVSDGFEVLKFLATSHLDVPVVLISGEDDEVLNSTAQLALQYQLKILGWTLKPIEPAMIQSFVDKANNYQYCKAVLPHTSMSERKIVEALQQNRFEAFFQPQICLDTYSIVGIEALAKIRAEDGEVIPPESFIAVAEKSNQNITLLTKAVINDALNKFHIARSVLPELSLSINISRKVLLDDTFSTWLINTVRNQRLPTDKIICELTETTLESHSAAVTSSILRLRMNKFRLSIDDFGTGYSTLEQLHLLPFQELKIDKCFVQNCLTNHKSRTVVEQSIQMARAMDLEVVAEGVETIEVERFLQSLGCKCAQGYLYSQPVDIDTLLQHPFINLARASQRVT